MTIEEESGSVVISGANGNANQTGFSGSNEIASDDHDADNSHVQEEEDPSIEKLDLDQELPEKKSGSQKKSAETKHANGVSQPNHSVPQTFDFATEKRASVSSHAPVIEVATVNGDESANPDTNQSTNTMKKAQGMARPASQKSLEPDQNIHSDDDDSCSATSSTTPSVKARLKTTVAVAPTFRVSERAEKRKEFYSKLEEKHQALEAARLQNEARIREEQEAARKELRKAMMFKANPMPSFYREGPPPKAELMKVPPTRAKSPKLGRRKSCSDSNAAESISGVCGRLHRHSLGTCNVSSNKARNRPNSGNRIRSKESKALQGEV